jgi:hypothetical protein
MFPVKRTFWSRLVLAPLLTLAAACCFPAGAAVPYPFFDGFESGNANNWTVGPGSYTRSVTSALAASGTYS